MFVTLITLDSLAPCPTALCWGSHIQDEQPPEDPQTSSQETGSRKRRSRPSPQEASLSTVQQVSRVFRRLAWDG